MYETIIVVYNTTGNIYYATCTRTAGGGSCNHVAALSFAIDAHNRTNPTPSCTSLPSKWNVSKSTKTPKDIPVSTLHIKKPSYLKPKKTGLPSPHTPISPNMSQVTIDRIMKLRQDLSEHCTHTLLFHQVGPETNSKIKFTSHFTTTINIVIVSLGSLPTLPHPNKLLINRLF